MPGAPVQPDLKFQISHFKFDLLGQPLPKISAEKEKYTFTLPPGAVFCLAPTEKPAGLSGDDYRRTRAQAAWALESLNKIIPAETIDGLDWRWLAEQVERSPKNFLAAAAEFAARDAKIPLASLLSEIEAGKVFPQVVGWTLIDRRRVTLVPPGHWLLIQDTAPFRATLKLWSAECGMRSENSGAIHVQSIPAGNVHVACFAPGTACEAELSLERYAATSQKVSAEICFLPPAPRPTLRTPRSSDLVLLTNGRGGMARLCVDLGRVNSKYDCALGANLNPDFPVDRHIFVKRLRVWVNADGFLSPLDFNSLAGFRAGPPAVWQFVASAGDGRTVEIELRAEMIEGENTTVFRFSRPTDERASGKPLPAAADVRLTVRFDIEDRNFHWETKRNGGADFHFASNTHDLSEVGRVTPCAPDMNEENVAHGVTRPTRRPASRSRLPKTGSFACFPTPANIIRNPNGARTFRIQLRKHAASQPAAMPTAPAGLNCRSPKAQTSRWSQRRKRRKHRNAEHRLGSKKGIHVNTPGRCPALHSPRNSNTPRINSSSGAAKAKRSSPAIRGFWIGGATR